MKTINLSHAEELAEQYVLDNFFEATVWAQETKDAYTTGYNAAVAGNEERHAKQLQELIDKFDCDKYHLENNHQIEMHEVLDKCFSDINEFTAKWEASDRKMDALHLKEVKRLKDYIETILFAIERAVHLCEVRRFVELNKPLSDILVSKK